MQRIFVISAVLLGFSPALHADPKVGDKAPELDVAVDQAGKPVTVASKRGSWVLMTFGAHWCEPCAKELPVWDRVAQAYAGRIEFWAVNLSNEIKDGKKFHQKLKLAHLFRVYLPQDKSKSAEAYETGTFPSTFVVDPTGTVRAIHKGFKKGDEAVLRKALDALLVAPAAVVPAAVAPSAVPAGPAGARGSSK